MVAVDADRVDFAPTSGSIAALPRLSSRGWTRPTALEWAGLSGLAGGALLVTFVLLGRPPLSLPTLAGLRTFSAVAAVGLVFCLAETWLLSRVAGYVTAGA